MRLPRVRFTVRRMMVAVAVVGLLAGLGVEGERRRERFREEAIHHFVIRSDGERARRLWAQLPTVFHERVAAIDAWLSYHERMEEKYDRAASFPWLPVAADPPEPRPFWLPAGDDPPGPRSIDTDKGGAADLGGYPSHPPRF
jgi:hypothetical protein